MTARRLAYALLLSTVLAASASAGGELDLSGFRRVAQIEVPLDGRAVSVQIPRGARRQDLRVVFSGSFKCALTGKSHRALTSPSPRYYVLWSPADLETAGTGVQGQAFEFPEDTRKLPESVTAWINIDQMVTDLIVTPSEAKQSLTGSLRLELWQRTRLSPLLTALGVLAVLAIFAVALAIGRRHAARMADVNTVLARIERKYESALKAVGDQREDAPRIRRRLEQLRDGARELAGYIAAFRRAAGTVDRDRLDGEIAEAQQQLEQTDRDDLRREIESTLAAKRKLHDLLADTKASEERYLLRLSKIEATIDSTIVWVTGQDKRLADERADEQAIAALERELKSLDEAIEELKMVG